MIKGWKYPIVFVGISILLKLLVLWLIPTLEEVTIFIPVLCLLLTVFISIRKGQVENQDAQATFKNALRSAMVFTLFYSGFILVYYLYINPDFFTIKLTERMQWMARQGSSRELMIEDYTKGKLYVLNPVSHAVYTFFGLMFLSLLYSAILSFLFRKRLLR